MKPVIPDPESMNPKHPVHVRNKCTQALNGTPGGPEPIQPRAVTKPGNMSMYTFLQLQKQAAEQALNVNIVWDGE